MNTLAILRGYFRLLSTTIIDYFSLSQSYYTLTITSYARRREHLKAFANACKHYKINEHSRNTSGVLSVTFDYSLTTSACVNLHLNLPLLQTRAIVNT